MASDNRNQFMEMKLQLGGILHDLSPPCNFEVLQEGGCGERRGLCRPEVPTRQPCPIDPGDRRGDPFDSRHGGKTS